MLVPKSLRVALAGHLRTWQCETPHANETDFVFPSFRAKGRKPLCSSVFIADYLRPAAKKAGVHIEDGQRFGLHNPRHSLSNWLANKTKVEPKTVQGILRHAKIQTTLDLYAQEGVCLARACLPAAGRRSYVPENRPSTEVVASPNLAEVAIAAAYEDQSGPTQSWPGLELKINKWWAWVDLSQTGVRALALFQAQLSDAIDRVSRDSGQTHSQVGCRITVSQFSCSYQVRLGGVVLTDAPFVHCRLLPQGVV